MRLSEEALESLRRVLAELGFGKELEAASQSDIEEFASFLLNLTAAAIKTREKLRSVGIDVPPSRFAGTEETPVSQQTLPGLWD